MLLVGKNWSKRYLAGLENMRKSFLSYIGTVGEKERRELLAIPPEMS